MKESINFIAVVAQMIIGLAILMGKADIRALAWYYVISGFIICSLVIIAGMALVINKGRS